jgi:hypothetical protein
MFRRLLLPLSLILIAACASAAPAKRHAVGPFESKWTSLPPGPVPIGFKSLLLHAQASEFHHGPQHFVQMNVWYPALAGSGTPMTLRDYVLLKTTENTYDEPTAATQQAALDEFTRSMPASMLDTPMVARQNAVTPANATRAPIVFIAPARDESAADHAMLAEFIASHGYVVVTVPSVTRLTANDDALRVQEQADDIDRAASAIGDWPNAINIPVSVIGFGLGADAALLYATQHPVLLPVLANQPAVEILAALDSMWAPIRPR